MGLSFALNAARSSLLATSSQIAVTSRNVAGASDPGYSRKIATLVSQSGGVSVVITRASDAALYGRMIGGTSDLANSDALLSGLQALQQTVGDTNGQTAVAAKLSTLAAALQSAANKPDDTTQLRAALEAARGVASSLNQGAAAVASTQEDADRAMADSVSSINDLLSQFDIANKAVMRGSAMGVDVTDDLDARDRVVAKLSEQLGITTVARAGGDVALYTDSGVPLYDRTPRAVTFAPTTVYGSGVTGNAVMVDGVPVTGPNSPMPLRSGKLAGLSQLRDVVAPAYGEQLDQIASGLVSAFAEAPTPPATGATLAGVFTSGSSSALPASATGLAATISLNGAVDPQQGGTLTLLRDGGINGSTYRANPAVSGNTAFAGRLNALTAALSATTTMGTPAGPNGTFSLTSYAAASAGWLEAQRKSASDTADQNQTLLGKASDALSSATGVNTNDESAQALQLEQSYAASAKLLSTVNDMLKTLMQAV